MEKPKKVIGKTQALAKLESYCAYQERSQQEARDKLYEYGLYPNEVEETISELIQNNFLNEERFAMAYAQGKFRMKHWGRIKIKQGLKLKRVSDKLITKALNSIDGDDYLKSLQSILTKKAALITEKHPQKRNYKLMSYALGKGYERDVVWDVIGQLE
ncbi:MAG: regulatory protein RecX [Sphingobacteriaceae bacterium]|jgi:regulatory protein|nr:regulatory protein RecX [Sphingobacteriaceae bacterium]